MKPIKSEKHKVNLYLSYIEWQDFQFPLSIKIILEIRKIIFAISS